jgi:hypothetical protein
MPPERYETVHSAATAVTDTTCRIRYHGHQDYVCILRVHRYRGSRMHVTSLKVMQYCGDPPFDSAENTWATIFSRAESRFLNLG